MLQSYHCKKLKASTHLRFFVIKIDNEITGEKWGNDFQDSLNKNKTSQTN